MKVLILSSSTGAGHDSCANAIKEVFDKNNETCKVEEVLKYISNGVTMVMTKGHTFIYRYFPKVFKIGYEFLDNHSSAYKKGSLTNRFLSIGSKKLGEHIKSENYDTVICTHPFATVMLAMAVEKCNLKIKTAFVATDYTCAPTVDAESLDVYFVPDNVIIDAFIEYGIKKEKIVTSGIPVRQMFYNSLPKSEAKSLVGIDCEHTHLLVMCGSMGCGPIKKMVDKIFVRMPEYAEITVVCGTNTRLKNKLDKKYNSSKAIHIKGFVENMSELLDSADLYLTKPGGLSVSEARQKNLPMVFINAVAGCEEYNRKHFVGMKTAVCTDDIGRLIEECLSLLENPEKIEQMRTIFVREEKNNASESIREYLLKQNDEEQ